MTTGTSRSFVNLDLRVSCVGQLGANWNSAIIKSRLRKRKKRQNHCAGAITRKILFRACSREHGGRRGHKVGGFLARRSIKRNVELSLGGLGMRLRSAMSHL